MRKPKSNEETDHHPVIASPFLHSVFLFRFSHQTLPFPSFPSPLLAQPRAADVIVIIFESARQQQQFFFSLQRFLFNNMCMNA
jgi:hypothetical protein